MKRFVVAVALLAVGPALAQNNLTTTQNPPAGKSSESTVQPANSLPSSSGTESSTKQPGSTLGGSTTAPSTGTATTAPSK